MRKLKRNALAVCLGDFNAISGTSHSDFPQVLGPHGSGIPNDNSQHLLGFCTGNSLRICGSWYRRPDTHRFTWISDDGFIRNEIDHVLVNSKWKAAQTAGSEEGLSSTPTTEQ